MTPPKLFLIDGSNNLYRSYYAIRGLTNSSGLSTNAVYGFITTLRKLLKDHKPDAVAVAFDAGSSTFRHKQFEGYKQDRRPMPDDLSVQIPLVYEACEGFGIPVLATPEFEADDLIGSLACKAAERGYHAVIATSDKDFFQLVNENVSFYHSTREVIYDAAGVKEIFGLEPKQVADVMAIWGDAIDNIPGVPGIGEKGAKALIQEFGSLDELYANIDKVKKAAQRAKLEEFRDQAFLSRELATIKCDLDVPFDPEELKLRPPDRAKLHDLFARLEFHSLLQEFLPEQAPVERRFEVVRDASDLQSLFDSSADLYFYVECENERGRPAALALTETGEQVWIVHSSDERFDAALATIFGAERRFIAHDVKTQLRRLHSLGLPEPTRIDDTMIISYVLNPGAYSHELESVARERLKRELGNRKELAKTAHTLLSEGAAAEYVGDRAVVTTVLHSMLGRELGNDADLRRIYDEIERPLIRVLFRMEERGIRIDVPLLAQMARSMGDQLSQLEKQIYSEAGETFNINSPSQLATILFEKLQYPVVKKTAKTKSYSTSVEVLNELASHGFVVPKLIVEHRELHKLKSTYVDALPQLVGDDGRVHTTFNQAIAATGRLSSSDPNLQNIPIRTELGRTIRRAFVADEGNVLLAADYSQIELRILAHVTEDEGLIDGFRRGVDIHRVTAAKMFNIAEELVTPDQRRAAKTINFGVLYGMSAFRLSNELSISGTEAKEFIDNYFNRYPRIRTYLDATLDEVRASGKVTTMFGRVRYIPEIHNRSFTVRGNAERMATNAPIQGAAADLLKMAMIALERRLSEECEGAGMLLTVHDEIVIETPERIVDRVNDVVKETMENIYPLRVPLQVDTQWGKSWYDAKE
jgi:DNA polymerase I